MTNMLGSIAIVVLSIYVFYLLFLQNRMGDLARVLNKNSQVEDKTGFAYLNEKVKGWRTLILSAISGGTQLLTLIDAETLQALPWGQVFDTHTANVISLVCAFLIPITHVVGKLEAAKTTPSE